MRTRLMTTVLCVMFATAAWAQKYGVSGTIIEKGTNEAVVAATVQVCTVQDTAFVKGMATDAKGAFKIQGLAKGKYLLKISFIGYQTRVLPIDLAKKDLDMGYLTLSTDEVMLAEAQVTANAAKVQVKGDSLVYNASAYRMAAGSMLEDLVKKLPGAEVSDDGTVKINGKEVKKILVDGKEFFINDKNIAMKNLPTNIIDNIKAYDRKSDLARVTGIDDGEEETVLDLTVKKGMNNGWFGQIQGGAGTESRYNARANVNRFNGSNQYSLVLGANNVGDRGFGGGGGRGWGMGGNGLQASKEAGFNFATLTPDEKLESGGYIWHRYDGSDSWRQSTTQNFVTPTGAFSNSTSQSYSSNASLSAGFRFEWKPDTMTNIIFRPNASYSRNRGSNFSKSGTYDEDPNLWSEDDMQKAENGFMNDETDDEIQDIINTIVNTNRSSQQTYSNSKGLNGELQLNRKLNSTGRNITLRLTGGLTNQESKQLSASAINYREGVRTDNYNNRYYTTPTRNRNFSAQITYSEPIADRTYLQFSYRFDYRRNMSDREAGIFDADPVAFTALSQALSTNRYDIPGALDQLASSGLLPNYDSLQADSLSQYSLYKNMDHTIGITLRRTRDNYNANIGFELLPQHSELDYRYLGKDYSGITRDVFNFTPTANFRYKFSNTTNLQFNYRGRTSQPSMTNLLEITDDSDPLNIRQGNASLKPSFNSNFLLFFNTYDVEHQRGIFANLNFGFTRNSISNRTWYDSETGVRTTKPENINGNWNAGGGIGLNTALDKNKALTLNANTDLRYTNSVSYLDPIQYPNDDRSKTTTINVGQWLGLNYRNDWFEFGLNGNLNYNHSDNNVVKNSKLDTYTFSYGAETQIIAPWGTTITSDIAMNSRRGYSQSTMNTNELIWNAQIAQSFLRGNALTISFEWNDILRERSNVSRTIDAMMSSDSRYNAIYSYGMLKVIYKLNIFGGKNANGTDNERDMWGNTRGNRGNFGGGRPGGGNFRNVRVTGR